MFEVGGESFGFFLQCLGNVRLLFILLVVLFLILVTWNILSIVIVVATILIVAIWSEVVAVSVIE